MQRRLPDHRTSLAFALVAALLCAGTATRAADVPPDPVAQRLAAIKELVSQSKEVCDAIPLVGVRTETERKAEASAKLNTVLSRIADVGASGAVRSNRVEYENVAQDKLADLLKDRDNCKANFVTTMAATVLAPAPAAPKPNP